MIRRKRSEFRARNHNGKSQYAAEIAMRDYARSEAHTRQLHSVRERSEAELETMRRAAQRRPGGWAAAYLVGKVQPAKKRAK